MSEDTILVRVSEDVDEALDGEEFRNGSNVRALPVDELTRNVNQFLTKIESILRDTPALIADFNFAEFEVSAEVSAEGKLSLWGTGVGVSGKGGLTFRFQRNSDQAPNL